MVEKSRGSNQSPRRLARVAQLLRQLGFRLCTPSSVSGSWRVHVTRSRLRRGSQRPVTDRHSRGVVFVRHGFLRRRLFVVQLPDRLASHGKRAPATGVTITYPVIWQNTTIDGHSRCRMSVLVLCARTDGSCADTHGDRMPQPPPRTRASDLRRNASPASQVWHWSKCGGYGSERQGR